ncbi:hypothetical protein Csa_014210 [Cucumis sativus]|uniref:Uncharacterized protein n=1 Tax=Cucumis sativus TaxID=3659 RepID=A0A0A0LTV5_CUCSA|nr:hypothetical protein Csa_014210 [Cucumis sativus]
MGTWGFIQTSVIFLARLVAMSRVEGGFPVVAGNGSSVTMSQLFTDPLEKESRLNEGSELKKRVKGHASQSEVRNKTMGEIPV